MAANLRIVLNRRAVSELLRSEEVAADLHRRATAIANAADAASGRPGDHLVDSTPTPTRARSAVVTATWNARHREADKRSLTQARDAGRA